MADTQAIRVRLFPGARFGDPDDVLCGKPQTNLPYPIPYEGRQLRILGTLEKRLASVRSRSAGEGLLVWD